jgi:hypothetical protein
MKKVAMLFITPLMVSISTPEPLEVKYEEPITELKAKDIKPLITEDELVRALIMVESRGNDSAVGDRHLVGNEAVGALQIRPIMVREVNRILRIQKINKRFKLKDRYNRKKTIQMFLIWKNFHHSDSSPEVTARSWNGGRKGPTMKATEKYWAKVQQALEM